MRVMHIFGNFGFGGAEMGAVRLIQSIEDSNIAHSICSISSNVSMKSLLPEGINCYSLGLNGRSYRAFIPLLGLLKSTKADIAHVNNLGSWFDVAVASKLAGCHCIETFHGVEEKLTKFPVWRRGLLKTACALSSRLTAVSEASKNLLMKLTGIKGQKIKIIPNGVDADLFSPPASQEEKRRIRISYHLPENGFLFGCVSALRPVKDHEGLIKAFSLFVSNNQNIAEQKNARLVLVGDGPLASQLQLYSRELGIQENVIFMGRRNDVSKLLQTFDGFVLNSRTEGMSYSILEAMSSGLPVIATHVGANTELIHHGTEGYLYAPGDLKSLTGYMADLIGNEAYLLKMKEAARKKVVEFYSIHKMMSSYKDLYKEVLSKKNGQIA
jgi:glycosyltransferase involved in cell wall biosynthesis